MAGREAKRLVSIIVPAHNAVAFLSDLGRCLRAIRYPHVEVVLVDDGSTDGTADAAGALGVPRLRVVRQEQRGLPAARNAGLAAARGEFVQFLDADDLISADKLARQVRVFEQRPEVGFVSGGARLFYRTVRRSREAPFVEPFADLLLALCGSNVCHSAGPLLRRRVLDEVGGFDESLEACEDWECWLRIARLGVPAVYVAGTWSWYRRHPEQMSGDARRMYAGYRAVCERVREVVAARVRGADPAADLFALQALRLFLRTADLAVEAGKADEAAEIVRSAAQWWQRARAVAGSSALAGLEAVSHATCAGVQTGEAFPGLSEVWEAVLAGLAVESRPLGVQRALEAEWLLRVRAGADGARWGERLRELAERLWHAAGVRARPRTDGGFITSLLERHVRQGRRRVLVFGAGRHTRWLLTRVAAGGAQFVAVVDEHPALAGTRVLGLPVLDPAEARAVAFDAVLISSDSAEAHLAARAREVLGDVPLIRPYSDPLP